MLIVPPPVTRYGLSAMSFSRLLAKSSARPLWFVPQLWLVLFRAVLLGVSSASSSVRRSDVSVAGAVLPRIAVAITVVVEAVEMFASGLTVSGRGSSGFASDVFFFATADSASMG